MHLVWFVTKFVCTESVTSDHLWKNALFSLWITITSQVSCSWERSWTLLWILDFVINYYSPWFGKVSDIRWGNNCSKLRWRRDLWILIMCLDTPKLWSNVIMIHDLVHFNDLNFHLCKTVNFATCKLNWYYCRNIGIVTSFHFCYRVGTYSFFQLLTSVYQYLKYFF